MFDLCSDDDSSSDDDEVVLVETKAAPRQQQRNGNNPSPSLGNNELVDLSLGDDEPLNSDDTDNIISGEQAEVPIIKKDRSQKTTKTDDRSASSASISTDDLRPPAKTPLHEFIQFVEFPVQFSTKTPLGFAIQNEENDDAGRWIVSDVSKDGQAERAGVRLSNFVVKVNGQEVMSAHENPTHIEDLINCAMRGDDETVTIIFLITVKMCATSCDAVRGPVASETSVGAVINNAGTTELCVNKFRFKLFSFDPKRKFGFDVSNCCKGGIASSHLVVSSVKAGSQAALMGVQVNCVLFSVDDKSVDLFASIGDGVQDIIQRAKESALKAGEKVKILMGSLPENHFVCDGAKMNGILSAKDVNAGEKANLLQEEEEVTTGECESASSFDSGFHNLSSKSYDKEIVKTKKRKLGTALKKRHGTKRGRQSADSRQNRGVLTAKDKGKADYYYRASPCQCDQKKNMTWRAMFQVKCDGPPVSVHIGHFETKIEAEKAVQVAVETMNKTVSSVVPFNKARQKAKEAGEAAARKLKLCRSEQPDERHCQGESGIAATALTTSEVCYIEGESKWRANYYHFGEMRHISDFETEEKAKKAAEVAIKKAAEISNTIPSKNALWIAKAVAISSVKDMAKDDGQKIPLGNGKSKQKLQKKRPRSVRKAGDSNKLQLGTRVYAEFPENRSFYWGIVSKIQSTDRVHVVFDDGDKAWVKKEKVFSESQLFKLEKKRPNPPPLPEHLKERFKAYLPGQSSSTPTIHQQNSTHKDKSSVELVDEDNTSQNESADENDDGDKEVEPPVAPMSLEALRQKACGSCNNCRVKDCGVCNSCNQNKSVGSDRKKVCLQKMCHQISLSNRLQKCSEVPGWVPSVSSWKFVVNPDERQGIYLKHTISRSTKGVQSYDYQSKLEPQLHYTKQALLDFLGISENGQDKMNLKQGSPFLIRWVDRCDRTREASGTIEKFSEYTCLIELSSSTARGLGVAPNQSVNSAVAVGGVLKYAYDYGGVSGSSSTVNEYKDCPHMIWVPPCNRRQRKDPITGLPIVYMTVNDRNFELRVKKSSIENAGYGVFMRYLPQEIPELELNGNVLNFGELIDVGVYAPHRDADIKWNCIMVLKDYIHSGKPEEWTFGNYFSEDHALDITDEITGDLHEIAKENLCSYVNETVDSSKHPQNIFAYHDPEGALHYLFGVEYSNDYSIEEYKTALSNLNKKLKSGDEFEVFINYGETYESIRIRKGYSISGSKWTDELNKQKYKDDFRDFVNWDLDEIRKGLSYLLNNFIPKDREVTMTKSVRKRAQKIVKQFLKVLSKEFEKLQLNETENVQELIVLGKTVQGKLKNCAVSNDDS